MERVSFIIASKSYILSKGMHLLVNEIRNAYVVNVVHDMDDLDSALKEHQPSVLFLSSDVASDLQDGLLNGLQNDYPEMKWVSLHLNSFPLKSKLSYACVLEEFASKTELSGCLNKLVAKLSLMEDNDDADKLSEREQMVLTQVAMGLTNKEIAEKLFISQHTVITHRKKITQKLGIKTISGLTVYAIINDLISMEDIGQN